VRQEFGKRPGGNTLASVLPSKPIADFRFTGLFIAQDATDHLPGTDDCLNNDGFIGQNLALMLGKGSPVSWVLSREGGHGVGLRIQLLLKENGEVVFDNIAQ
jgi:hypothetical protein